jgi:hypothetical protein
MDIAHFDRQGSSGMVLPFVVARIGAEWRIKFPRLSRVFCGIPLPLATPVLSFRHVHVHQWFHSRLGQHVIIVF